MTKITTLVDDKFMLEETQAVNRNLGLLKTAVELLYATFITDTQAAAHRGEALQAINAIALRLGYGNLLTERERHE